MPNVEEVLLARVSSITCHTFYSLLNAMGKSYALQGQHPITVFVPSDIAFGTLHEGTVYDLLKDPDKLEELLDFHLVPTRLTRFDVANLMLQLVDQESRINSNAVHSSASTKERALQVDTLAAYPLTVSLVEDKLRVNDREVYEADIVADNGVIHVLNNILWPPGLSEASFRSPLVTC